MPLKAALSGKHCNRHCASSACPTPATQIGNQLGGRSRCRLPIFGTRAPSQRQLAEYRRDERASGTRPLRPPARQASRSPGPPPWPLPPPLPQPPHSGKPAGQRADAGICTLSSAAHGAASADLVRGSSVAAPPSVAVRAKQTVPHTAPGPRFPSAIRPWIPGRSGIRRYKAARPGTQTKQPTSRENPASGHIRSVWHVLGSNQRRLRRRFYRPLSLCASQSATDRLI